MAVQQQNWSNHSDNKNEIISKGKVKAIDRKKNNIEDDDCTKKDKGGINLGLNKGIEMKKHKEVKGTGKSKGSKKDKNIIEDECMMEIQV